MTQEERIIVSADTTITTADHHHQEKKTTDIYDDQCQCENMNWYWTEEERKKLAPVDQKEVLYNCKLVLLFSISSKSQRRAMDTHSLKVSMFPVKWSSPILQLFHSPALTLLTGLSVPDTISGGGGSGGGGIECPHTLVLVLVLVSSCLPLVVFVHRNFFTLVSTESEQSIVLIAIASINTQTDRHKLDDSSVNFPTRFVLFVAHYSFIRLYRQRLSPPPPPEKTLPTHKTF